MLLDANPMVDIANARRIDSVIFGGNVYTHEDLDDLLSYVEGRAKSLPVSVKLFWREVL